MKRYEVTGIPISPPFSVLAGRRVGDQFEADVDPDFEQLLVSGGALRILPNKPLADKKTSPTAKEAPAPAPAKEPEPEPAKDPEPPAAEPAPEPEPAPAPKVEPAKAEPKSLHRPRRGN